MELVIIALAVIIVIPIAKKIKARTLKRKAAKKAEKEKIEAKVNDTKRWLSEVSDTTNKPNLSVQPGAHSRSGAVSDTTNRPNSSGLKITRRFTVVIGESSRYMQRWDENYDKQLGYEWFKICTEYVNYPDYNSFSQRLVNIRKSQGSTQLVIARCLGISNKTLSAYENGYSYPSDSTLQAISKCYKVPIRFLTKGIGDDLISHAKLCRRYGEEQYIESLIISVRAASRMFHELLTIEDLELCIKLDNELGLGIGFADIIEKGKKKKEITQQLLNILNDGDINQTKFYSSLGDNRQLGINIVKELSYNGIISKIPKGKTYILHLNDTKGQ